MFSPKYTTRWTIWKKLFLLWPSQRGSVPASVRCSPEESRWAEWRGGSAGWGWRRATDGVNVFFFLGILHVARILSINQLARIRKWGPLGVQFSHPEITRLVNLRGPMRIPQRGSWKWYLRARSAVSINSSRVGDSSFSRICILLRPIIPRKFSSNGSVFFAKPSSKERED